MSQTAPAVTVIMPAYNAGSYIGKAIASVLAQTRQDWELIIVNDGSTDHTASIAASCTDPRIHYLEQENLGPASARNRGIREATGQYLAFLDADDIWAPEFLNVMVSALSSFGHTSYVCCGSGFIDDSGAIHPRMQLPRTLSMSWVDDLIHNHSHLPHTVLCRRAQVNELGGFDSAIYGTEDWDLWLRLEKKWGMPIAVQKILAFYRLHGNSISTNPERMLENLTRVIEKHVTSVEQEHRESVRGQALASALLSTAIIYLMQNDQPNATRCLCRAVTHDPAFLERDALYYELLCNDQPKGHRGDVERIDLTRSVTEATNALAKITNSALSKITQRNAYARLMLTASEMAWQQGNLTQSRQMWLRALSSSPSTALSRRSVRLGTRALLGHDAISMLKRLRTRIVPKMEHDTGD